jgi:diphthamide biosynthesis methyltransferase
MGDHALFCWPGAFDERDVSVKGLQTIMDADLVYAEFYTLAHGSHLKSSPVSPAKRSNS